MGQRTIPNRLHQNHQGLAIVPYFNRSVSGLLQVPVRAVERDEHTRSENEKDGGSEKRGEFRDGIPERTHK